MSAQAVVAQDNNDKTNTTTTNSSNSGSNSSSSMDKESTKSSETNTTTTSLSPTSSLVDVGGGRCDICNVKEFLAQLPRWVIRQKLAKRRHLVCPKLISPCYLDAIFPQVMQQFQPQQVTYNGGIAKIKEWKISCYLEVMQGGVPCTNPHGGMLSVCRNLLDTCDVLFQHWYRQQHSVLPQTVVRLMTFVTRYTPAPGEQALLKHIDGAGKVDGSIVVALPTTTPFEGGGLTFWDGKRPTVSSTPPPTPPPQSDETRNNHNNKRRSSPEEIHYDTRSGDVAFIDRAVWHQADPITSGIRWALVIFYKVERNTETL